MRDCSLLQIPVCVFKTERIPGSVCTREKQNVMRRFRSKTVEMANSKSSLAQAVCHRAVSLDRKGTKPAILYALLIWLCQVPLQPHLSFWQVTEIFIGPAHLTVKFAVVAQRVDGGSVPCKELYSFDLGQMIWPPMRDAYGG